MSLPFYVFLLIAILLTALLLVLIVRLLTWYYQVNEENFNRKVREQIGMYTPNCYEAKSTREKLDRLIKHLKLTEDYDKDHKELRFRKIEN